jgi:hypothetical protein
MLGASAQIKKDKKGESQYILRPNGSFSGLCGFFFRQRERLHVYSEVPEILNNETGKFEREPDSDELEPYWKCEPYYHEVYDLLDGAWVQRRREFSQPPDEAVHLTHCDQWDRRNLPIEIGIKRELPARIKIKAIRKSSDYAIVVYTDPSQQSPDELNHAPLEVDLLVPDREGWKVADSQEVDEYGYFCGSETFDTRLAQGEIATVLLIYTEDDSADSNYYSAKSFIVRPQAPQRPEK